MRGNRNYFNSDTIVALSGALGGAISLVRISGPSAIQIIKKLTPEHHSELTHRLATRVDLFSHAKKKIDDAVVTVFYSPNSFTGEDCVEISVHASPWIVTTLIEETVKSGARQALPGEFSFRAVRSGKLSVNQAQAIPELIGSKNQTAAELALDKLGGLQNKWVVEIADSLRRAAMLSEVGIDFSDQDLEELNLEALKKQIKLILPKLIQVEKSFERGKQIQDGIPTAIVGLPNAGKSSFFNALLGEDRSIVSDIPGTTRDVVKESLTLSNKHRSVTLKIADTAGIRKSEDQIEEQGVERSAKAMRDAELVLWVIDSKNPEWNKIEKLWVEHGFESKNAVIVLNKEDLLSEKEKENLRSSINSKAPTVFISAKSGAEIQVAVEQIVDSSWNKVVRAPGELVLTQLDHLNAVRSSINDIERALVASEYELFAADIRQCLAHLSELMGETSSDDILGKIFSEFCIGK